MARPTIPASVLAQRGKSITLLDDSTVAVVFTFSSLMRLEEDFGSIKGALAEIQGGEDAKAFTALAQIIASGLEHETYGDDGLPLSDVETLRQLLDPMRFGEYSEALGDALQAAFPSTQDDGAGEGDDDPQRDSLGESGTTSAPSRSDAASTSSGTA